MNGSLAVMPNGTTWCIPLGINSTVPWDNPYNLITLETERVVDRINAAYLVPLLFLVGVPANVVNMIVFFKQGLKERINFCLFSLALADAVTLSLGFGLYAERIYTQFTHGEKYGAFYREVMNKNIMGLYGISYVPNFMSAVIATERCICVLFPLQAQTCVSTKVLAGVIIIGACVLGFTRFVITAQYYVTCVYEMRTRRTSWQVFLNDYHFRNREMLVILDGVFYGFGVAVGGPVVVFVTTVITALKLQQMTKWRSSTSSSSLSSLSSKEIAVTKMLLCLSTECFLLSTPAMVLRILPMFEPQLSVAGLYANTFTTLITFGGVCFYTSSTINFFVYYSTGSRYRATLKALCARMSTQ